MNIMRLRTLKKKNMKRMSNTIANKDNNYTNELNICHGVHPSIQKFLSSNNSAVIKHTLPTGASTSNANNYFPKSCSTLSEFTEQQSFTTENRNGLEEEKEGTSMMLRRMDNADAYSPGSLFPLSGSIKNSLLQPLLTLNSEGSNEETTFLSSPKSTKSTTEYLLQQSHAVQRDVLMMRRKNELAMLINLRNSMNARNVESISFPLPSSYQGLRRDSDSYICSMLPSSSSTSYHDVRTRGLSQKTTLAEKINPPLFINQDRNTRNQQNISQEQGSNTTHSQVMKIALKGLIAMQLATK